MVRAAALLVFVCLTAACSTSRQVAAHRSELLAATAPDVPLATKRDVLGASVVEMMHQAVDRLDPRRGFTYVEAYAKTNGPFVDTLAAQIERATADMTTGERIAFGLEAAASPYVRDAVEIVPRFVERYRRIAAAARIVDGLKASVLGQAGAGLPFGIGGAGGFVEARERGAAPTPLARQGAG